MTGSTVYRSSINFLLLILLCFGSVYIHAKYGYSWPSSGHAFGSDDAFISYRYAANLFSGIGLVFNFSEAVEGYSNFLYVMLMAPGMMLGYERIYLYSVLVNAALFFLCCVMLSRIVKTALGEMYGVIGGVMLALTPALWVNAATGLESVLVLLIYLSMWLVVAQPSPRLIVLCLVSLASILTRVDGFILPLITVGVLWLTDKRREAYWLLGFVVISMLVYTAARISYYGDYIANTYHAKITGELFERITSGGQILYRQGILNGVFVYVAITAAVLLFCRDVVGRNLFQLIILAVTLLYFIYIGGDIYYERFLLIVYPVGIFFTLLASKKMSSNVLKPALPLIALSAAFIVVFQDARFSYQVKTYDMWNNLGRFLAKVEPGSLLAIDAAGKVPYYSGLPTLDMLGLNDRHIGQRSMPVEPFIVGHAKHDADYVLSKRPTLIAAWALQGQDLRWGLTREKYSANYEIKYLVNSFFETKGHDILDVQGLSPDKINNLITSGYNYAVLGRRDQLNKLPLVK